VTMGATLVWPAVAVLGFLLFTGVVVALGTSSTARYEFERNGAGAPQRTAAHGRGAHPARGRAPSRPTGAADAQPRPQAVGLAVRPAPATPAGGPAWWLVGESAQVLAGPFADQIDADWAALADGLPAVSVFGARRADSSVAVKPSPAERAWLGQLGAELDRLPEEWDALLSDTDPLTTLVVEVAAAVVEAGLPLQDPRPRDAAGGVCLVPEPGLRGVLVSWRPHDRMSLHQVRGAAADDAVQDLMNATIADVLAQLRFVVEPYGATGCVLVTALR
jgi:hypothetical protein